MLQSEKLGIQEGIAASPEAELAEIGHGQIPFS